MPKQTKLAKWRETQETPVSMTDCAASVGVSKSTWSRWERGIEAVGIKAVPRVAKLTGMQFWELRPDVYAREGQAA